MESEDPREREALKNLIHSLYIMLHGQRPFIRRCMGGFFREFIQSQSRGTGVYKRHTGTSELLEILASIVNGFSVPLKEEHVSFLKDKVLILVRTKTALSIFYPSLFGCLCQYMAKESALSVTILKGLLRCTTLDPAPHKNYLIINTVESMLPFISASAKEHGHGTLLPRLFSFVSTTILSTSYQCSERSLRLFNNPLFVSILSEHKSLPQTSSIVSAVWKKSKEKFPSSVRLSACNALNTVYERDKNLLHR